MLNERAYLNVYNPPPDELGVATSQEEPKDRPSIKDAADAFRKEFGNAPWFHELLKSPAANYLIVVVNAAYYPGGFKGPEKPEKLWMGWPITVAKLPKFACKPPPEPVAISLEQVFHKVIGLHAHEPWYVDSFPARTNDHILLYVDRRSYPKDGKSHWLQDGWPIQVVYPSTKWIDRMRAENQGDMEFMG